MTLFNLNYLLKSLSLDIVVLAGSGVVRASTYEGGYNLVHCTDLQGVSFRGIEAVLGAQRPGSHPSLLLTGSVALGESHALPGIIWKMISSG